MRSLNRVMLIGNLGADPEIRSTPSGQSVANFRMATSEMVGGRDGGQAQEKTEWHKVVAWGRLAEITRDYLRKGQKVFIEGRLQTREWTDQTGNKRWSTEIVAQNMLMLTPRGEGGGQGGPGAGGGEGGGGYNSGYRAPSRPQPAPPSDGPGGGMPPVDSPPFYDGGGDPGMDGGDDVPF